MQMAEKKYDQRLLIAMPDELVQAIDNARRVEPDIPNRSEMIRRLLTAACEEKGYLK